MSTGAERQRKRRQRLRRLGIVDSTVPVPEARRQELRHFARGLRSGAAFPAGTGPLLAAIAALKAIQPELKRAGVFRAGVFGSAARGEAGPESDIDIVIDFDARRIGDVVAYVKIADRIKSAIKARCPDVGVDVADQASLKPRVRERVERDAVYAF